MTVSTAADRAAAFLKRAADFQLGHLVTESPHAETRELSAVAATDAAGAIRLLQKVDRDLPAVLKATAASAGYAALEAAMADSLAGGGRIFFTGCGATGRLSILLEAMWAKACTAAGRGDDAGRVASVMAGGDFALIKSVEGFEDFEVFGRRQIGEHDGGPRPGDTVVAITEGGETTFVIGTAWAGVDAGAKTFFVYNNPDERLEPVERSRRVIEDDRITKLNLTTGCMAVAGSTRMQATTIQLAVVGMALERSFAKWAGVEATPIDAYLAQFDRLLDGLESPSSVEAMAELAAMEAELYGREGQRAGSPGRVLYLADELLLDVMTDTTERSPTFSLPAFRPKDRPGDPASWSFVKDPFRPTPQAWDRLLGRPLRGLDWTVDEYRAMEAPEDVIAHPPKLDRATVHGFEIGDEPNDGVFAATVALVAPGEAALAAKPHDVTLRIGAGAPAGVNGARQLVMDVAIDETPMRLGLHLAAKVALNAVSTASMAIIGRLSGNWMVHVRCSNLKLIDRGIRLLIDQTELSYEDACRALFEAIVELESASAEEAAGSPVARALAKHRAGS
ncbi:MAG: sugar phosphate isomerase [Planctomycetota bacterium]